MSAADLVQELESLGVFLWEEDGKLRFRAPKGVLTDDRRAALMAAKQALLDHLRAGAAPIVPHEASRYDPFPLTDVQAAYLIGRRRSLPYGGVGCHAYGELTLPAIDPARLQAAWRALIRRHDMLRAIVQPEGIQQVLRDVPDYTIATLDRRGLGAGAAAEALSATRAEMGHRVYDPAVWPLFDLRVSLLDGECLIHVSIDFLIADYVSIFVLLGELKRLYDEPDAPLPPLAITFRDYLLASRERRAGAAYERDRAWWLARLESLPPAPELPIGEETQDDEPVRFRRWELALEPDEWQALARHAAGQGLTASGAMLAAYADVIGRWSRRQQFTLDVTLLNRPDLHPDVPQIVGDFTSVELLAVDHREPGPFGARARQLQARLAEDLDHTRFSGVEVIRELARARGTREALMPVVFTSALGLSAIGGRMPLGEFAGGISQTPQVWIDCQAMERAGRLSVNWDVREGVVPLECVDAMFDAFRLLVERLARDTSVWDDDAPVPLPADQAERRAAMNDTAAPMPDARLFDGFLDWAARDPSRPCLLSDDGTLTYGELLAQARGLQAALYAAGIAPRELVAVIAEKGAGQVIAVLGILLAGGVYLPIEASDPPRRRDEMLADAGVRLAVCGGVADLPESITIVALDGIVPLDTSAIAAGSEAQAMGRRDAAAVAATVSEPAPGTADDLAYVIYTSGSTGRPKGVMITHRAAMNTIVDINRRFGVTADDRVLCVSSLAFDLSVYDIFGLLLAGGALVFPQAARRGDPSHWADLVARHGVTVWNSVPGLMGMLQDYLAATPDAEAGSLRLVMLSGDWVPVSLVTRIAARLPQAELFALGGATEGAIWSIYFPANELSLEGTFVPYGRPLANQTMHVLDEALRPCPEGVTGEIAIGGAGVALGYFGDAERTRARFVEGRHGEGRIYRTGDLGRYLPDGHIEILGREDAQVKIRGHRVELGEVEAAAAAHPAVAQAIAIVSGTAADHRRLVLFVEPARVDPPPAPDVAGAGDIASAGVLENYRESDYLAYAAALDRAAFGSMIETFQAAGLFQDAAPHDLDEILARLAAPPHYHRLIRRWLHGLERHGLIAREHGHHEQSGRDRYRLQAGARDAQALGADAWRGVEALAPRFDEPALIDYFRRCGANLPALIRGEGSPLALLYPDGRTDLSISFNERSFFNQWGNAVLAAMAAGACEETAASRPPRVLEVGGGVGATAASVLARLPESAEYWFTDVSQYFLNAAAPQFAGDHRVRCATLDLNRQFRDQGFTPNSFDLVVAGDVLHAARNVPQALVHLKELLRPGGWLVFVEMTRDHGQIMTSLELLNTSEHGLSGYEDTREARDQTFFPREEWERLLAASGGEPVVSLPRADDPFSAIGLCAFAVRYKADRGAVSSEDLTEFLRTRVPEYMVPPAIVLIDQVPLTANGKIDRRRLRAWEPAGATGTRTAAAFDDDLMERVAAIWGRVLNSTPDPDVDFFAAGGDSLLAAELTGKMLEGLPEASSIFFDDLLRRVLNGPTLRDLTAGLRAAQDAAAGAAGDAASSAIALEDDALPPAIADANEGAGTGAGASANAFCLLFDDTGAAPAAGAAARTDNGNASALHALAETLQDALPGGMRLATIRVTRAAGTAGEQAGRWRARLRERAAADVALVGAGYGALIAFELGRQLLESGDDAPRVTLSVLLSDGRGPEGDGAELGARFAGDLTLIRTGSGAASLGTGAAPGAGTRTGADEDVAFWEARCLGDVRVVDIAPDRADGARADDAARLAALIAGLDA